jgi:protease I
MKPKIILTLIFLILIIGCTEQKPEVNKMPKKALLIVAQEGYQDHEYGETKKVLEEGGVEVITASKEVGPCQGSFGSSTEATVALAEVNVDDYDAIVFIGGSGASVYQHDVQAHLTAQEAINRNKILAAICISPTTLAYAGVLEGKKATVWDDGQRTQAKILEDNGATYLAEDVVVDGNIITANGPPAAEKFGQAILEKLK